MKTCKYCGAIIPENEIKCPSCGNELDTKNKIIGVIYFVLPFAGFIFKSISAFMFSLFSIFIFSVLAILVKILEKICKKNISNIIYKIWYAITIAIVIPCLFVPRLPTIIGHLGDGYYKNTNEQICYKEAAKWYCGKENGCKWQKTQWYCYDIDREGWVEEDYDKTGTPKGFKYLSREYKNAYDVDSFEDSPYYIGDMYK